MVGNMGLRKMVRFNGAPAGSASNFDPFRAIAKAGKAKKRVAVPIVQLPKVSHSLKFPLGSRIANKIKLIYPKSEPRRIVATEVINFLAMHPTASQEDVATHVVFKLKGKGIKIDYSQKVNGVVRSYHKDVGVNSVIDIYKVLIGPKGIVRKTKL